MRGHKNIKGSDRSEISVQYLLCATMRNAHDSDRDFKCFDHVFNASVIRNFLYYQSFKKWVNTQTKDVKI